MTDLSTSSVTEPETVDGTHGRRFRSHADASSFLWSIADLLRGDYKRHDYGKVILPLTVLRRIHCLLGPEPDILALLGRGNSVEDRRWVDVLERACAESFGGPFGAGEIFVDCFKLPEQIERLRRADLFDLVASRFRDVDLSPEAVSNHEMGLIFEDLIHRFAEQSNETAGEHFTPREVIRLMVDLLFAEDQPPERRPDQAQSLYDPACGTGGMLSVAEESWRESSRSTVGLDVFGQELNPESYAICRADMLIKGQEPGNIVLGNSFSEDGHAGRRFEYMLSNPPFGVDWKKVETIVRREHRELGFDGRFGAGLPRINDGSFLFLQHMLDKRKPPSEGGSRLAIVFNGSPLFTGDAGSGESEIRRWILENDWLETIVALPDQLFFGTGIYTYLWVLTNRKSARRRGRVQLIHAVDLHRRMEKSLGDKRHELAPEQIAEIARLHRDFVDDERSKILPTHAFGYRRIVVEQPMRRSFSITDRGVDKLESSAPFRRLAHSRRQGEAGDQQRAKGRALQQALGRLLRDRIGQSAIDDRARFRAAFEAWIADAGIEVPASVREACVSAFGVRDAQAAICRDAEGQPEPDPELRDTEKVPLAEDIDHYFEAHVLPHVAEAWVDPARTKIGYEIPFARTFHRDEVPRSLAEIEIDIQRIEGEIRSLLTEILA